MGHHTALEVVINLLRVIVVIVARPDFTVGPFVIQAGIAAATDTLVCVSLLEAVT